MSLSEWADARIHPFGTETLDLVISRAGAVRMMLLTRRVIILRSRKAGRAPGIRRCVMVPGRSVHTYSDSGPGDMLMHEYR